MCYIVFMSKMDTIVFIMYKHAETAELHTEK